MSEPLSVYEFGERLLDTNDLDPVYILLWNADLNPYQLRQWLLAYWCFYHVGTTSWIVDQPEYWVAMRTAAASKEYPRCHERRHFRGENARKSVEWLAHRGIGKLFGPLVSRQPKPLKEIMESVQTWVGFGPWIAFKVADMLERLSLCPVEFDAGAMFLFDSPRKGAELAWRMAGKGTPGKDAGEWAVSSILSHLASRLSPPRYERGVNVQEAETVLCKWRSYVGGHYRLGEDVEGCRKGLLRFARSKTSQRLLKAGKVGGLW